MAAINIEDIIYVFLKALRLRKLISCTSYLIKISRNSQPKMVPMPLE